MKQALFMGIHGGCTIPISFQFSNVIILCNKSFPVAQWLKKGASNATVIGFKPRGLQIVINKCIVAYNAM